ncbi:LysE family translocator [Actinoplanes sp. TBRC 11911]|uniref:LysE family translocator n=1 Tax=Actinoplanes sp. TBRC 11911 TaxID=2729386 RepID=UPI00145D7C87|nr:LysE family translocator [Actinoplanes sp. TBRC 11911]NMO50538.1 LysE family translocator [Actinoplanes sp. TBRC 11911]
MLTHLLTFGALAALIIVVPGPDLALITRTAMTHGRWPVLAVCAGTVAGILFHATIAMLGVTAIVTASAAAFTILQIAGGLYLAYLGITGLLQTILAARVPERGDAEADPGARRTIGSAFRQGVLSNALNPKVAVFFVTFVPQFVRAGHAVLPQTMALSAVFLSIAAVWHTTYALLILRLQRFFRRPSVRHVLEVLTSLVLLGLGARLALELL